MISFRQQSCGGIVAVRIVRLGSARNNKEGIRIGTVRRPPRGIPKSAFSSQDWYDVWFPNLAPSAETLKLAHQAKTAAEWRTFFNRYRAEMATPENAHTIALLAALSHHTDFSVGCYCEDESHCHRSMLRTLLAKQGAQLAST
jgi:uncharacterized protein YeaO (DUF488 family)